MSEILDERIQEEIEALQAILMDDVSIEYDEEETHPVRIKTVVFPSTADDVNRQYVCMTLEVTLVPGYPDCEPEVVLRNPRGLDDSVIDEISLAIKDKCKENTGQPVLFELIELIRERLTESNLPSCQCAICLYGFKHGDLFTKTQCYHYFHSYCLASHLVSTERHFNEEQEKLPSWQKNTSGFQPLCPVCREPISCDLEELKSAPPPLELENARQFEVTAELRALQAKMAALFSYQQRRGGIIDVEAEESKLLVVTETTQNNTIASEAVVESPPGPSITTSPQRTAPTTGHRVYRGFHRHSRNNRGHSSRPAAFTR